MRRKKMNENEVGAVVLRNALYKIGDTVYRVDKNCLIWEYEVISVSVTVDKMGTYYKYKLKSALEVVESSNLMAFSSLDDAESFAEELNEVMKNKIQNRR